MSQVELNKVAKQNKFQTEDLPKVLQALQDARSQGVASTIVIAVAPNGGILSVIRKSEKNYK